MNLFRRLWNDDAGALIATEWVFIASIMICGLVAGLRSVQQGLTQQLDGLAQTILSLNTGYSFSGQENSEASTAGSVRIDNLIFKVPGDPTKISPDRPSQDPCE